jgi:hypothetical protein
MSQRSAELLSGFEARKRAAGRKHRKLAATPATPVIKPRSSASSANVRKNVAENPNIRGMTVGERVESRWLGQEVWYSGVIVKIHRNKTCDVQYNDGDYEKGVMAKLLRPARDAPGYIPPVQPMGSWTFACGSAAVTNASPPPSLPASASAGLSSKAATRGEDIAGAPKKKKRTAAMVKRSIDPDSDWLCDWCGCPERDSKGKDRGPRGSSTLCAR